VWGVHGADGGGGGGAVMMLSSVGSEGTFLAFVEVEHFRQGPSFRTKVPSIYAVGDVIPGQSFLCFCVWVGGWVGERRGGRAPRGASC
jgi:hypothetical protein